MIYIGTPAMNALLIGGGLVMLAWVGICVHHIITTWNYFDEK